MQGQARITTIKKILVTLAFSNIYLPSGTILATGQNYESVSYLFFPSFLKIKSDKSSNLDVFLFCIRCRKKKLFIPLTENTPGRGRNFEERM